MKKLNFYMMVLIASISGNSYAGEVISSGSCKYMEVNVYTQEHLDEYYDNKPVIPATGSIKWTITKSSNGSQKLNLTEIPDNSNKNASITDMLKFKHEFIVSKGIGRVLSSHEPDWSYKAKDGTGYIGSNPLKYNLDTRALKLDLYLTKQSELARNEVDNYSLNILDNANNNKLGGTFSHSWSRTIYDLTTEPRYDTNGNVVGEKQVRDYNHVLAYSTIDNDYKLYDCE